jgi:hypothetical protein
LWTSGLPGDVAEWERETKWKRLVGGAGIFFTFFFLFFKNTQSRNNLGNYISSAVGTAVGVQSVSKFYNFLFKLGWR